MAESTVKRAIALAGIFALFSLSSAKMISFEYYPDNSCSSPELSAVTLQAKSGSKSCHNLASPGESFHIGSPESEAQLPKGCQITGYADENCNGAINLEIEGKSSGSTCYTTGHFMGDTVSIQSVKIRCD